MMKALFTLCLAGLVAAHDHDVVLRGGLVKRRCGSNHSNDTPSSRLLYKGPSSCPCGSNTPDSSFEPINQIVINVKVHCIIDKDGKGRLTKEQIRSGIELLNEDFSATAFRAKGSNDTKISFNLVETNYIADNQGFNDQGNFWNKVPNLNTEKFINIYTNAASGSLGYVPGFPQCSNLAGRAEDRVVVLWEVYGSNPKFGAPYNLGATLTHEMGHFFGLEHTFTDGCGSKNAKCGESGDFICDTNAEADPHYGGCPASGGGTVPKSCGKARPYKSYMDYSDDACMTEFTPEQSARMRCTIATYRSGLDSGDGPGPTAAPTTAPTTAPTSAPTTAPNTAPTAAPTPGDRLSPPPPSPPDTEDDAPSPPPPSPPPPSPPEEKYFKADKNKECPKNLRITSRKNCEEAGEELTKWNGKKTKVKKSRNRPRCYAIVKKGKTRLFYNPSPETKKPKKKAQALCEN